MTTSADSISWELVLEAVRAVPGVRDAEVEPDVEGSVLRLDLADEAAEDAVRAAVDAALDEPFGVSAESVGTRETSGPFAADEGRLRTDRLTITRSPDGSAVEVLLRLDERSAPGAKAGVEPDDEPRAVAEAVLFALEELTEDAVIGSVEELQWLESGDTVRVRLSLDVDGAVVAASGSAPVLGSTLQAVLRAVLEAVEPHLPV